VGLGEVRFSAVPEPGAVGGVTVLGLLGFAAWRRRIV
jgi:hypothetical protein